MVANNLDPLTRLAIRFGSDKFGAHLSTPIYHRMFGAGSATTRCRSAIRQPSSPAEAASGASARCPDRQSPNSENTPPTCAGSHRPLGACHSRRCQPPEYAAAVRAGGLEHGPFDIVIDDGSHLVPHVLTTFLFLYPRLGASATYVVEDTQTSFSPATGGNSAGSDTIFSLAHAIALAMHKSEGHVAAPARPQAAALGDITAAVNIHRNLIVFERGDNTYPSNMAFSLADAGVERVFRLIEREAGNNPSDRGALSRIDMAIWGGDKQKAADLALLSATANPYDAEVLTELIRMMEWAGCRPEAQAIGLRLQHAASR